MVHDRHFRPQVIPDCVQVLIVIAQGGMHVREGQSWYLGDNRIGCQSLVLMQNDYVGYADPVAREARLPPKNTWDRCDGYGHGVLPLFIIDYRRFDGRETGPVSDVRRGYERGQCGWNIVRQLVGTGMILRYEFSGWKS